jgi:hypothetical protein
LLDDLIILNEDQLIAQIKRMVGTTGTEVGKIRKKIYDWSRLLEGRNLFMHGGNLVWILPS